MNEEKTWLWLADNLALDFLNTLLIRHGEFTETLHEDEDVRHWLAEGSLVAETDRPIKAGLLLRAAVELREAIRAAVQDRKQGREVDTAVLNRFLQHRVARLHLAKQRGHGLTLVEEHATGDEMELLSPVAHAAARLLVDADFNLVRQCEGSACVLWFHDSTKAHRRRWCSMATCGNRHKVEAFRSRSQITEKKPLPKRPIPKL
jgi:predicted RNA-binding Zn ribbon-like protein